ncbi:glycoside hydrolase family 85 protein [Daedalea quercina L-15889]|uniref:Glycoside hydrolase family 85 protein n=1 Tax=Daedalea quercina L-15889 TaxID=1314783 RepID=A0A165UAC0_9APHY|nr:glycoside hydrolase family 85 protein [Daedalea quercina L-15889]
MPLHGINHNDTARGDAPYFQSLAELDQWAGKPHLKLDGILPYLERPSTITDAALDNRGKLLVNKPGGYTETPSGLAYTFNFWSYCESFIYFSHHRVTVPPPGWINAAHRQGVKMLGTLIFEHDAGQQDCLRLLVGRLPQSKNGPVAPSTDTSLPLSPHYARLLADLAYQRGFDGYLLNVEVPLVGGVEQTRALSAWISILENNIKQKVGPHAQAIWYDSVVVTGDLRWQDRLNNYNLPFFLPSSGFFANYTWRPDYPSLTAQYFFSLEPSLTGISKQLQDIYIGIDVWGRGQHGGGGFGSYKSLAHIDPEFLGLSVALFGPAWSWETEQDKPGFSWETWWAYERKLWLGPETEGEVVEVPAYRPRQGEPDCQHGAFAPISSFFPRRAPPNPRELPFLTYFSPGVGYSWFVQGAKLYETKSGWTDLDKTTSLGDLAWPRPTPQWADDEGAPPIPAAFTSLCMTDAWLGGSSLCISLSLGVQEAEDSGRRRLWIPIQTLALTPNISHTVTLVYKTPAGSPLELDVAPAVKELEASSSHSFDVRQKTPQSSGLPRGWMSLQADVILSSDDPSDVLAILGLDIRLIAQAAANSLDILLGLISVHPTSLSDVLVCQPKLLWADYALTSVNASRFSGLLSWEIATSLGSLTSVALARDPEDPSPLWKLDTTQPTFAFFNIYVQEFKSNWSIGGLETAIWIGTTGLDGKRNRFQVDPACLPLTVSSAKAVRFYVQGVTDRGAILTWDNCVFVDVHSD